MLLVAGCLDAGAPPPETPPESPAGGNYIQCTDPRPEACTQQYLPVCASRDTGIRCITTPCDSAQWKTYGNACGACSDPDVYGYIEGTCDAMAEITKTH